MSDTIILYTGLRSNLAVRPAMHIAKEEGGHLIVVPKRHVRERSSLSPSELLEIEFLSIVGAHVLKAVCGADWINYQENGNWQLGNPEKQQMHLHIYGRKRGAKIQTFGDALVFPKLEDKGGNWRHPTFTNEEIDAAKRTIEEVVSGQWGNAFLKEIDKLNAGGDIAFATALF